MQQRGIDPPRIVAVDELLESEDILDMLNAGMIGMTVLDDYKARFWSQVFPNIKVRDDLVVHDGRWQEGVDLEQVGRDLRGQWGHALVSRSLAQ